MAYRFDEATEVAEVQVDEATTVKVRLVPDGNGGHVIDAREFVSSARYTGPTKHGLMLPVDVAKALADALCAAAEGGKEEP